MHSRTIQPQLKKFDMLSLALWLTFLVPAWSDCYEAASEGWSGVSWVATYQQTAYVRFKPMDCAMKVYLNDLPYGQDGWEVGRECGGTVQAGEETSVTCTHGGGGYLTIHTAVYGSCQSVRPRICDVSSTIVLGSPVVGSRLDVQWRTGSWGSCSRNCGGGSRTRSVTCSMSGFCNTIYPPDETQSCNTQDCEWSISWGSCSQECGGGTQSASLSCEEPGTCGTEPVSQRACNTHSCQWQSSSWSSCSQPCGGGTQTRSVTCPVSGSCSGVQPVSQQECNTHGCQWEASAWGSCSRPCAGGSQTRAISCPRSGFCHETQPVSQQDCNTNSCQWQPSSWSSCSQPCGGGKQTRSVTCPISGLCGVPPASEQDCNTHNCQWEASWGPCSEECGGGLQEATASCPISGLCSGEMPSYQPRDCNTQACGCGLVGENICYHPIGSCSKPVLDMDECQEVSYEHSYVSGTSLGLCGSVSTGGGLEFTGGVGVAGGGASVEASITSEVCYEGSTEIGTAKTQLVKVPGRVGKTMVACAQGLHHDFGSGRYWLSYRQGGFTICEDACPEPACREGPADVTPAKSNKAGMSFSGQTKSCIACVLVPAFLSML